MTFAKGEVLSFFETATKSHVFCHVVLSLSSLLWDISRKFSESANE